MLATRNIHYLLEIKQYCINILTRLDPMSIYPRQALDGPPSCIAPLPSDQNPISVEQILDSRALSQKLGVREDLVRHSRLLVGPQNGDNALGSLDGHGRLLHDDLVPAVDGSHDVSGGGLDELEVGCAVLALSEGLGGRVDGDEDEVGLTDGVWNVSGEVEVPAPAAFDDLVKTGLINGQLIRVPLLEKWQK